MKVVNADTIVKRDPVPYTTVEAPDLPTEPRTRDVEDWRRKIEAKRETTARIREGLAAGRAAEYSQAVQRTEPPAPASIPDSAPDADQVPVEPAPSHEPASTPVEDLRSGSSVAAESAPVKPSRPSRRPMSSTELAGIVTAYLEGSTIPELAAQHDRSTATIRRSLLGAGVTLRDDRKTHSGAKPRKPEQDDPAVVAAVRRLYVDQGLTRAEVAERLHVGLGVVEGIMARHGIAARPAAPRDPHDRAAALRDRMAEHGITSSDVRAWAREAGHEVPTHGLPPAALVDAYLAAHGHAPTPEPAPAPMPQPQDTTDPTVGPAIATAGALAAATDEVVTALEGVIDASEALLAAQQQVAAFRVRRLRALADELLAVLQTRGAR